MDILMEQNFDEMIFDLNPFLAEIYSNNNSSTTTSSGVSDQGGGGGAAAAFDQLRISSTSSWNGQETISPSSSTMGVATHPLLISFENDDRFSPTNADHHATEYCNLTPQIINFSPSAGDDLGKRERASAPATRTPLQAQDHVMAERKRRDNLRQLFIALSKVVPGLKKLDKASLLEDAINYLKVLQERVVALEKEEIVDNTSSSFLESPSDSSCGLAPAEISVRISDRNVLIKICCKKQMGLMSRIPCEMERMHLSVIDIRIMPFGGAAIDVTILAEVQSGFVGTVQDIVKHLQAVVGQV